MPAVEGRDQRLHRQVGAVAAQGVAPGLQVVGPGQVPGAALAGGVVLVAQVDAVLAPCPGRRRSPGRPARRRPGCRRGSPGSRRGRRPGPRPGPRWCRSRGGRLGQVGDGPARRCPGRRSGRGRGRAAPAGWRGPASSRPAPRWASRSSATAPRSAPPAACPRQARQRRRGRRPHPAGRGRPSPQHQLGGQAPSDRRADVPGRGRRRDGRP